MKSFKDSALVLTLTYIKRKCMIGLNETQIKRKVLFYVEQNALMLLHQSKMSFSCSG